jgi:hypothetical protein
MVPVAQHAQALEVGHLLPICSVAKARLLACISSRGRLRPNFFSIAFSIGRPWQSQPGM